MTAQRLGREEAVEDARGLVRGSLGKGPGKEGSGGAGRRRHGPRKPGGYALDRGVGAASMEAGREVTFCLHRTRPL